MDDVLKVSTSYILERVNYYDLPLYEFAVHLFEQQAQFFPQWRLWVNFTTVVTHNKVKEPRYFYFYIFNYFLHGPNVWQPQIFSTLRRIVASRRSDLKLIVTSATFTFPTPGRTLITYFAKSVQEDYVMAADKQAYHK